MDKYEKAILAIILSIVILTVSYAILIISDILGPFDLGFPFYILMPSCFLRYGFQLSIKSDKNS